MLHSVHTLLNFISLDVIFPCLRNPPPSHQVSTPPPPTLLSLSLGNFRDPPWKVVLATPAQISTRHQTAWKVMYAYSRSDGKC